MDFLKVNKRFYLVIFSLWALSVAFINAQNIDGYVYSLDSLGNNIPVQGANVYFRNSQSYATTNADGWYRVKKSTRGGAYIIASFIGYKTDSIYISDTDDIEKIDFVLKEGTKLQEVYVKASQKGTVFSKRDIVKTENITSTGLMKMACCNLAESFENSATITSAHTDAVSGAKQIQLLGLSGIYSQVLGENIPIMRGLASGFGWNYTPGAWLESIQISKGTSSVLNGYESVTGQINLEFKKPDKVEDFYSELYADEHSRYELNITGSRQVAKDLWSNLFVNASTATWSSFIKKNTATYNYHDRNADHFMDMPKTKLINVYNRWLYVSPSKRVQSRTGVQFLNEDRFGGQSAECHVVDVYYTSDIVNRSFYVYNKTGIAVGNKPGQSIGIINSFTNYSLESVFGPVQTYKLFNGYQKSFNSNVLFNSFIQNTNHQFAIGASFGYDNYETLYKDQMPENNVPLTSMDRIENVTGIMGQYTYNGSKITLIVGLREDYNSKYGWLFTPRTNIRFGITENIVLRASVGCGYRAPNVISDNLGYLASTRMIEVAAIDSMGIEKAWNYGTNATFYIPIWNSQRLTLSIDYFRTNFASQVILDLDRDRNNIFVYNSSARNNTNALQTDISFSIIRGLDVFAAFRYNRSWYTLRNGNNSYFVEKPLISKYRGLLNVSYATKFRKWVFDYTIQLNGPSRLPSANGYLAAVKNSPTYYIQFIQITKNTKRVDFYLGAENITDYRQKNPIIGAENPFVKGFDASQIWGPLMGRKVYVGLRFRLGKMN
jgi:outer membrane receptor for ferrienterochelin and colicin